MIVRERTHGQTDGWIPRQTENVNTFQLSWKVLKRVHSSFHF